MNEKILNIRLQMETLITEREGMIAENQQRIHRGESLAYTEMQFATLSNEFTKLLEVLRNG